MSMGTRATRGSVSRCSLDLVERTLAQLVAVSEVSHEGRPEGLRKQR